ncbi:YbaN family protein [Terasakiispira papahanaumokuakeensis]|nr:YbaN family protein [Terasakiispira papahanaumokuakeensis]
MAPDDIKTRDNPGAMVWDANSALMASGWKRRAYQCLAYLSLGVALLGVILPGLPATEFVLLSAWAASRSSPRLQRWLYQHRLFGPMLYNWHQGGIVTRRTKWMMTLSMSAGAIILWLHQPPLWLLACALVGMALGAIWVWRRPETSN